MPTRVSCILTATKIAHISISSFANPTSSRVWLDIYKQATIQSRCKPSREDCSLSNLCHSCLLRRYPNQPLQSPRDCVKLVECTVALFHPQTNLEFRLRSCRRLRQLLKNIQALLGPSQGFCLHGFTILVDH